MQADAANDQRLARHLASLYWEKQPESTLADISIDTLKEYIAFSRAQIPCPKISDAAQALLAQSYLEMRMAGQDPTGALNKCVTPRNSRTNPVICKGETCCVIYEIGQCLLCTFMICIQRKSCSGIVSWD